MKISENKDKVKGGVVQSCIVNRMISAVILNYNDSKTTMKLAETISRYSIIEHVVVVDNCSDDDSYKIMKKTRSFKVDVIKTDKNGGYGYGNNYGIRYASRRYGTKYVLICNPDIEVSNNTIENCLNFALNHEECAVVAPLMLDSNHQLNMKCVWKIPTFCQYLFFSLPIMGRFFQSMYYKENELLKSEKQYIEVGCVAGSLLLVKAEKMLKCGMYDENIFLYCEETLLGLKMKRLNYKTYLLTDETFVHYHSVSINKSIESKVHQAKIMWNSRLYILNKYYIKTFFGKLLAGFIAKVALAEIYVIEWIKKDHDKR